MGSRVLEQTGSEAKQKWSALRPSSPLHFEEISVKGYERVVKVTDEKAGLTGIIAIHSTALGPALGGIRIHPYAKFDDALFDVLRLSRGMTFKSAVAEVGFGGGKSVIIADPRKGKTPELLLAFGQAVESLGGSYICAEDVGCTTEDVKVVRRATKHVVGLAHAKSSGDPGPFTAWGTYRGICATLKQIYGTDSVEGRTIAIQGLGNVGMVLAEFLFWGGARLILSDIDGAKLQKVGAKLGAQTVSPIQIMNVECDIFSPCAMGGILNDKTIPLLRCKGVAGCANNQLLKDKHADDLRKNSILYAPDFVINAGGLLNVSIELEPDGYVPMIARGKVNRIYDTLMAIYEIAEKNKESTHSAALALADYRIRYGIGKRAQEPTFHHTPEQ